MILKKNFIEKRKHPRLDNNVPLKICHENGDVVTETGNISRSGVYCKVTKYIEPMMKLKIYLLLPFKKSGKNITKKVTCQGVVVRTESISEQDCFNVAIFFNDISQRDSEMISEYVCNFSENEKKS